MTRIRLILGVVLLFALAVHSEKVLDTVLGDACCGGKAYFQDSQTCCPKGKLIDGSYESCCDGKGWNPSQGELCCTGEEETNNWKDGKFKDKYEFLINADRLNGISPAGMPLQCCGKGAIDTRIQICCDGEHIDIREEADSKGDFCCNGRLMDSKEALCCDKEIVKLSKKERKRVENFKCCGTTKKAYDTESEFCCGNDIFKPKNDESFEFMACCGEEGIYNSRSETCCVETHPVKGLKHRILKGLGTCCGDELYNTDFETCCRGSDGRKTNVVSTPNAQCCGSEELDESIGTACCGDETYDSKVSTCCSTQDEDSGETKYRIVDGLGTCCGLKTLIPKGANATCCEEEVISGKGVCCGKDLLTDRETQICCNRKLRTLLPDGRDTCCGKKLYNPDIEVCCDEDESDIEIGDSCCDGKGYFKDFHSCCKKNIVHGTEEMGLVCCGEEAHFPEVQTCCDEKKGGILDLPNAICCDGKALQPGQVCCRDD